jgi:hypothetical protein
MEFSKHTRSYATRINLDNSLAKLGLLQYQPLICRTPEGKWTAVFGYALSRHPNPASIARHGFMVIN